MLGEAGNFEGLPEAIAAESGLNSVIQIYRGSSKKFFVELAESLGVPTTEPKVNANGDETGERSLTVEELKEAIAENIPPNTLLIFPEARRLTTSIRYWLEEVMDQLLIVAIAVAVPKKDIYLEMIEVELSLPSDQDIREIMRREAETVGLDVDEYRLAKLQAIAGRNPLLARKAVRNELHGLNPDPEHHQYLDISPIIISAIMALSIVRFIGMGTGDKALYIIGGVALVLGLMLKQIGKVRGESRRYGQ